MLERDFEQLNERRECEYAPIDTNGKSAAQLECEEFNKTVNTRQVRRHYARVMAKRGGNE